MKRLLLAASVSVACLTAADSPAAQFVCCTTEHRTGRPDAHAPISIMGDHTHDQNGWMLSSRYMHMEMDGMRHGTRDLSSNDLFDAGYTVTPERMTMDMYMFGFMYAASEELTCMLMVNYLDIEMDHRINPAAPAMLLNAVGGDRFTTHSSGFGDTQLTALYKFCGTDNRRGHIGLGLSLPTGAIDEQDNTPLPGMPPSFPQQQLPATMQLGSGTVDLLPSITYRQQFEDWSYGLQTRGTIRLQDENDHNYRLGHQLELTAWAGCVLTEWLSLGGGLSYEYTDELKGTQENVGTAGPAGRSVTTAFGENYGGERLDTILGINLLTPSGRLKGHRLAVDIRLPLWQDLNGDQLETDWVFTLGWQKVW